MNRERRRSSYELEFPSKLRKTTIYDVITTEVTKCDTFTKQTIFPFPTLAGGHSSVYELISSYAHEFECELHTEIPIQHLSICTFKNSFISLFDDKLTFHNNNTIISFEKVVNIFSISEDAFLIVFRNHMIIYNQGVFSTDNEVHNVTCACTIDDNTFATSDSNGMLKIWNNSGTQLLSIFDDTTFIATCIFALNDYIVIGDNCGVVHVFKDYSFVYRFNCDRLYVNSIVITSSNLILTAGDELTLKVWDLESGLLVRKLYHESSVQKICMHLNYLVSCNDEGVMKVWENEKDCIRTIKAHQHSVRFIGSIGSKLITSGYDDKIKIWI